MDAAQQSTRRSLYFAFLDRYASLAINIGSTMILARLLSPGEIGVFAVTMAIVALPSTLRDLGAGQYLLQERELDTVRIRAVWTVQLGVGLMLASIVSAASLPAAAFYGDRRVGDIMMLVALNFAVNPLGSVTYSWLIREMRYDAVAVMRSTATLSGAVVSVAFAGAGWGPISLAFGSVCATLTNALVSVAYRPPGYPWLPGFAEVRRVLIYGSRMTVSSILDTLSGAAPEFLLGKLQSLAAAGLYSRANGLVAMLHRLVNDAVTVVMSSVFAKEARENHGSAQSFLRAAAYVTALGWSFGGAVALLAHPLVRVLYGPQWDDAVDPARMLALGALGSCIVPICFAAAVGYGAARKVLVTTWQTFFLCLAAAGLGAWLGVLPMATAYAAMSIVAAAMWLRVAKGLVQFSWAELLGACRPSVGVAVGATAVPALTTLGFGWTPLNVVAPFAIGVAGSLAGFLLGVHFSRHPVRAEVTRMVSHAKQYARGVGARRP